MEARENWRSGWGFVLAAAGSAVGLGNLWGFAYKASQGGGAAFLMIYLLIVFIVCIPVLIAEMVLGRSTGGALFLFGIPSAAVWIFLDESTGVAFPQFLEVQDHIWG